MSRTPNEREKKEKILTKSTKQRYKIVIWTVFDVQYAYSAFVYSRMLYLESIPNTTASVDQTGWMKKHIMATFEMRNKQLHEKLNEKYVYRNKVTARCPWNRQIISTMIAIAIQNSETKVLSRMKAVRYSLFKDKKKYS